MLNYPRPLRQKFNNESLFTFKYNWSSNHCCFNHNSLYVLNLLTKPGGLDVETNRDRDRERP